MSAMDADMTLLQRYASRGDEQAFAQIVQRYANLVYATSRRVLGDDARAQEVAQETFFQLVRKAGTVRQSLAGWLHRTATRLAIDVLRSDRSRRARESRHVQIEARQETSWQEISPHVDEALLALDDDDRALLVQHFLQGVSQAELAAQRGVSRPTIHRRIRDALERLRVQLGRMGVGAAVAVVVTLLEQTASASVAPPAMLMTELGKISLVSGQASATGWGAGASGGLPDWSATWSITKSALPMTMVGAGVIGGIVLAGLAITSLRDAGSISPSNAPPPPMVTNDRTRAPSDHAQVSAGTVPRSNIEAAPKRESSDDEAVVYVYLPDGTGELSSIRVEMFQHPRTSDGEHLLVGFGDGHVKQMPLAEATALIEGQCDKSIAQIIAEASIAAEANVGAPGRR